MATRLELHEVLKDLMGGPTSKVYFQPPPQHQMSYPCIVYQRDDARTEFAGNRPYSFTQRYQVTLIDTNPDHLAREKIAALPMCRYERYFAANKLNHDVFVIYF
jgi:hypothetical protein